MEEGGQEGGQEGEKQEGGQEGGQEGEAEKRRKAHIVGLDSRHNLLSWCKIFREKGLILSQHFRKCEHDQQKIFRKFYKNIFKKNFLTGTFSSFIII